MPDSACGVAAIPSLARGAWQSERIPEGPLRTTNVRTAQPSHRRATRQGQAPPARPSPP